MQWGFFNRIGPWVCYLCFLCIFTQDNWYFLGYEHRFLREWGCWCCCVGGWALKILNLAKSPLGRVFHTSKEQKILFWKMLFPAPELKPKQSLENIERRRSDGKKIIIIINHFKGLIYPAIAAEESLECSFCALPLIFILEELSRQKGKRFGDAPLGWRGHRRSHGAVHWPCRMNLLQ